MSHINNFICFGKQRVHAVLLHNVTVLFYLLAQGHQGINKEGRKGEPGPKGIKGEKGRPMSIGELEKNQTVITIPVSNYHP